MRTRCEREAYRKGWWLLLLCLVFSGRHAEVHAGEDFAEESSGLFVERPDSHQRKLAWVISISPNFVEKYSHVLSSFNCYSLWQEDVTVYFETETLIKGRHFFYERLRNIEKYMPHFQWVVHSDADVLVANFSRNPWDYIDDAYDVLLQIRDGRKELHAGMIFIKNSIGGRQFVTEWADFSRQHGVLLNYDNGDLHELILSKVGAAECSRADMEIWEWDDYFVKFLPCFWQEIGPFLVNKTEDSVAFHGQNFSAKAYQMDHGFLQECEDPDPDNCSLDRLAVHSKHLKAMMGRHLVQCNNFSRPTHRESGAIS